ncbi:18225_t:CDS:2, partial [Cetraspora pellucida]
KKRLIDALEFLVHVFTQIKPKIQKVHMFFKIDIKDYEKYGHEHWKTAMDYNHAFRGRWDKLKFTNQCLEAPLYALAAILLQVKNSSYFTPQELDDAKDILDKVNSRKEEGENSEKGMSSNSTTDIKLECDLNNAMALIRTYGKEISLSIKAFIQNSINKNLINKANKLLVKAEPEAISGGVVGSAALLNTGINLALCHKKALSAYDKEKYQEFIDILSEEYDENKRLLNFHDKVGIAGIDIINTLKMHGFRSDGIAYLLVILGEILGSGKIDIEDFVLSEERTRLALEYLQDFLEMPLFSRLEEVRNIAKINIAILNIIEYDDDAYKEAKQTVEEVRRSVKENYQFIIKSKLRLEVLEDFLWVINGEDPSDLSDTSLLSRCNEDRSGIG